MTITFLAGELDGLVRGRIINGICIVEDRLIWIRLGGDEVLKFLSEPGFPVLCLATLSTSEKRRARPTSMPRFADPLEGATITAVVQVDLDRIVRIDAVHPASGPLALHFEITPPFPNLFLVSADGRVAAMLHKAGTHTRKRALGLGEVYVPPMLQPKRHPLQITEDELEALLRSSDPEALSRTILGVSPFLAREIVSRAATGGSVAAAFGGLIDAYKAGLVTPFMFVARAPVSKPPGIGIAWFRPCQEGVADLRPMPSINDAADGALQAFLRAHRAERLRAGLRRVIGREIARWQKIERAANLAERDAPRAQEYRRSGELIIANLARIKKGAREVLLPDIHSLGASKVRVALEPHLTPHANADAYFKKARKAERRARLARETLAVARRESDRLSRLFQESQADLAPAGRLREIEHDLGRGSTPGRIESVPADERSLRLGIRPRRFTVSGNWTVLVGRSAEENDVLTHKYAGPSDLWFHARQAQGSHVVLRRDRKKAEPSRQAVLEAAALAAYYSKAKTAKHVPVSYTEKRYVKRVRGGAPGLCAMLREKVVFVSPGLPSA